MACASGVLKLTWPAVAGAPRKFECTATTTTLSGYALRIAVVCVIPFGQLTQEAPVNSSINTTRFVFSGGVVLLFKGISTSQSEQEKRTEIEIKMKSIFSYKKLLFDSKQFRQVANTNINTHLIKICFSQRRKVAKQEKLDYQPSPINHPLSTINYHLSTILKRTRNTQSHAAKCRFQSANTAGTNNAFPLLNVSQSESIGSFCVNHST